MKNTGFRKYLGNLLIALAAIIIALAACEIMLRVLKLPSSHVVPWPGRDSAWKNAIHQKSSIPGLDYELRPGAKTAHNGVDISINSLGMRGQEIKLQKAPGQIRILAVGDSFTFGYGVSDRDTFPEELNQLLKKNFPSQDIQVLNLGVSGYGSADEALVIKHKAAAYSPDLVIIGYVLNDPQNRQMDPLHVFFHHSWWQHSNLLAAMAIAKEKVEIRLIGKGDYYIYLYENPDRWSASPRAFKEISEWSLKNRAPVLVVIFPNITPPDAWPSDYPYKKIHRRVADEAERQGLKTFDLYPELSAYPARQLIFSARNIHFNPRGNRIVAEHLLNYLTKNYPGLFSK
jgi:lysophospholipase L1-like esterase